MFFLFCNSFLPESSRTWGVRYLNPLKWNIDLIQVSSCFSPTWTSVPPPLWHSASWPLTSSPPQCWRPWAQPQPSPSVWPCTTAPCAPSWKTRWPSGWSPRCSTSSGTCSSSGLASWPSPSSPLCCPASSSATSFAPGWFYSSSSGDPRPASWIPPVQNGFTEPLWASFGISTGLMWRTGPPGPGCCSTTGTNCWIFPSSAACGAGR